MRRNFWYGALLVIIVWGVVEVASRADWFKMPEAFYYDTWHQLAGRRYLPENVVIAAIDDQTRLERQDEPLVFWSPHIARALEVLRKVGVRVVGLDYLFSASAESWLKKLGLPDPQQSRRFDLPFREQLASGKVVLAANLVIDEKGMRKVLLPLADYWLSLPGKLDDVGLVNFYNDPDGVIRQFVPILADDEGEAWVTFATRLAERAGAAEPVGKGQPLLYVNFAGPPGTIPRLSFRRLLAPQAEMDPDILRLKDKLVILGAELSGQQDIALTPYARGFLGRGALMMTGPELHANIVETILTGRFPQPVPTVIRWFYLLLVVTLGTLIFFRLSPLVGLAAGVILGLACGAVAYLLFWRDLILPVAGVQVGLILTYLGSLGVRLTGEERERARLRQIFGRYVADEVVEKLLAAGKHPDLGGEAFQVTVLFADIRNFTTISEHLRPHEVVEMLNTYFTRVCEPILEQGGMVDKFIGDGVMAVFGAPAAHPDHARRAIKSALAMAAKAQEFRAWMAQRFKGLGLPDFHIGIGLNTGEAVVGNIGSPKRLEFTSIGDTVNTASRLEGLTKELGWTMVASIETIKAAGPGVVTGRREKLQVKGRQEAIEVIELLGLDSEEPNI
ncbi:MAG: adenylate/guanylate cyclase domain-containing protein [Desulfobaccales bacterium]|nr:adenylate/guanylate cyclase domain-containing protein [Desulfobaccales bacterium]